MRSSLLTVATTNAICHTDCYLLDNCDFLLTLPQAQQRQAERERERKGQLCELCPTNRSSFFSPLADTARMRFAGATGELSATPRRTVQPRRQSTHLSTNLIYLENVDFFPTRSLIEYSTGPAWLNVSVSVAASVAVSSAVSVAVAASVYLYLYLYLFLFLLRRKSMEEIGAAQSSVNAR